MNIDSASAENGQAIADRMMRNWGGQSIYFLPKGISGRASNGIIRFTASAMGVIMSWPKVQFDTAVGFIKIVKRVHTEKQQAPAAYAVSDIGMAYSDKRYTPGAATGAG